MYNSFPIDMLKMTIVNSSRIERPESTYDNRILDRKNLIVSCEIGIWVKNENDRWVLFLDHKFVQDWRPYHRPSVDLVIREQHLHKIITTGSDIEIGGRVLVFNQTEEHTDHYFIELVERDVSGIKWKKWDPTEPHHSEVTKQQVALEPKEQKLEEKETLATSDENMFLTHGPIGFVSTETLKKIINPEQSDEHVVHGYPMFSVHRRASRAIHEVYVKMTEEQAANILRKTDKE